MPDAQSGTTNITPEFSQKDNYISHLLTLESHAGDR